MNRQEQLAMLKNGKERWNEWRREQPDVVPDLMAADLHGMILKQLDLRRARLHGANLVRADLFGSDLSGAQLSGANLSEVRAAHVNFSGADLRGCSLNWAFLVKAHLNGTRLNGTDLSAARFKGSSLVQADLTGALLKGTHLNHSDLTGADLSGAVIDEIDLQDSYLPNTEIWGDIFAAYRQQSQHISPPPSEEQEGPRFLVKSSPRLIIKDTGGPIHIHPWSKPEIMVVGRGAAPQLQQEQDTLFISEATEELEIYVPRIPHGIVQLVQHGSNTITTEISAENIQGDISIEGSGAVRLSEIYGKVTLHAVTGDVVLDHLHQRVVLTQTTGNIRIQDAHQAMMDTVRGNVIGARIHKALHCAYVAGNCSIQESPQAEITVGRVGGNLCLHGIARALDCHVGGNADLCITIAHGGYALVEAGGNLKAVLPEEANLRVSVTAGNAISQGEQNLGGSAYLVYGQGRDTLDLTAAGDVVL